MQDSASPIHSKTDGLSTMISARQRIADSRRCVAEQTSEDAQVGPSVLIGPCGDSTVSV